MSYGWECISLRGTRYLLDVPFDASDELGDRFSEFTFLAQGQLVVPVAPQGSQGGPRAEKSSEVIALTCGYGSLPP